MTETSNDRRPGLRADVTTLLEDARRTYAGSDLQEPLDRLSQRFDEPLRVAFAGKVKAGKSTLLNALVGEQLAPTDAGECTKIVTWYRDSHTYRVTRHPHAGEPCQLRFHRDEGAIEIDLGGATPEEIERLEIEWPSKRLSETTLVDTPGLASVMDQHSARTRKFLAIDTDADAGEADAVIYLMRHLHGTDLGFLEAFHDDAVARANPISTLGVLSRADEVGACRPDAMTAARRVAARYRRDPRLRRLCQTIVPVAGLVAQAAVTLTEADHRCLQALADLPRTISDELCLSVDRFVAERSDVDVTPAEREDLLDRLGLYGIRTSLGLIRVGGADTAGKLSEELLAMSGVEELRTLLSGLFASRRDILKARAVLSALNRTLRNRDDDDAERLLGEIERITASAHELIEIDLLNTVRSATLPFTESEVSELERLLGDPSGATGARLGCDAGEEHRFATEGAARWRKRAENPLTGRDLARAAQAVARSYEGIALAVTPAAT